MLVPLLAAAALAACPSSPEALSGELSSAYDAYLAFDTAGFRVLARQAHEDAACLDGVLEPIAASKLHLVEALHAWVDKDGAAMVASFRGLRSADPVYEPPADLAPAGSGLRQGFESAGAAGPGPEEAVEVGDGIRLLVDGRPTARLPTQRAALVQVERADAPLRSWYLRPGAAPDDIIGAVRPSPPAAASTARSGARKSHPSRTLLISGLAVGVASGAALLAAQGTKDAYASNDDVGEEEPLFQWNQVLGYGGYGLGVVAVGLGATAVFVGRG
jgi:hypothetical protein